MMEIIIIKKMEICIFIEMKIVKVRAEMGLSYLAVYLMNKKIHKEDFKIK